MIKKILFCLVLACLIGLTAFSPKQAIAATSTANNRLGTPADERTLYEDFTVGGIWYIKVKRPNNGSNGEVYAAGISIDMEKVVIPAVVTYNGKKYNVLGINDYGFAYETAIKSVVVENGVKYIGVEAFWDCSGLEKVSIGDSVNEIGRGCFSRCPALKQANIPDSLKIIPYGMFAGTSLKEITLGKNTTIIDESAFAGCTSLKTVKCNKKLTTIKMMAFTNCTALESIKLPSSLKTLGKSSFAFCNSLKSITVPKKVKEIPDGCFSYCENLAKVKIPKKIVKIGFGAFMTCPSLKTVSGKNSKLSEIGGQAFEGDEKLESINVPNVKSIGEWAFYRTGLKTIKLGEKLEYLGEQAFSYSQLERITVPGSVKVIRKETFANCHNLKEVVFKPGVERLEERVFDWCERLVDISFPKTINYITYYAVCDTGWFALKQGKFAKEKGDYVQYDYLVGSPNSHYDYSKRPGYICVNDICIWIDHDDVFEGEFGWRTEPKKKLEFPSEARMIACNIRTERNIDEIIIPEGVEILAADIKCGYDSKYEKSVKISLPASLKELGGCITGGRFTSITLPENLESLVGGVFYEAKFLQDVEFTGKKLTEIPVDCFRDTLELKKVVIPEGVETICERAFDGSGITEVSLPSTLKTIGSLAFINCPIDSVKLPKKLTSIDESAFRNTKLSKIDLPDGIQEIGQSAFESTGIKKFTLPDDFEIKKDFVFDKTVTMVVKKNSKAHKALEEFMNHYSSDFWTVEYKK